MKKINPKKILKMLQSPQVRDYTYAILFFVVSSFFAFFVVRPVLSIAISLKREGQDLERINKVYEGNIAEVLKLQADLEEIRPQLYLLDEALPSNPELNNLVLELRRTGQEQNVKIENVSIEGIQIKGDEQNQSGDTIEKIGIRISINGDFNDVGRFMNALIDQRRIKTIHSIALTRGVIIGEDELPIPVLTLSMDVQAYHL